MKLGFQPHLITTLWALCHQRRTQGGYKVRLGPQLHLITTLCAPLAAQGPTRWLQGESGSPATPYNHLAGLEATRWLQGTAGDPDSPYNHLVGTCAAKGAHKVVIRWLRVPICPKNQKGLLTGELSLCKLSSTQDMRSSTTEVSLSTKEMQSSRQEPCSSHLCR